MNEIGEILAPRPQLPLTHIEMAKSWSKLHYFPSNLLQNFLNASSKMNAMKVLLGFGRKPSELGEILVKNHHFTMTRLQTCILSYTLHQSQKTWWIRVGQVPNSLLSKK
jgi:VanZ family protein